MGNHLLLVEEAHREVMEDNLQQVMDQTILKVVAILVEEVEQQVDIARVVINKVVVTRMDHKVSNKAMEAITRVVVMAASQVVPAVVATATEVVEEEVVVDMVVVEMVVVGMEDMEVAETTEVATVIAEALNLLAILIMGVITSMKME